MIFKSPVFSQASGSIAGVVYSRNAGGMYVRSRANPTNPNTDAQQAVRDAMRTINNFWTQTLGPTERDDWNTYAFNTPTLNKLGEPTHKTGQNMFMRANVSRLQAGLPLAQTAPVIFDTGTFTPIASPVCDGSADTVSIAFNDEDEWANTDDAALLIYMSRPQNPSRNFGKGPFQLLVAILGDATTPPTTPTVVASLFPLAELQKVFFQVRATMPDGRLSGKQNPTSIVVA